MAEFTFSENNSGGHWWLKKRDYEKLFEAGWKYEPSEWDIKNSYDKKSFFGDEADDVPYGWRHDLTFEAGSIREAVESWENATGRDFFEEGCNCCGAPFSISGEHDYLSGNSVDRRVIRPW